MFLPTAQNRYPSNLNQLDIAAVLSPHSNDEVLSGGKVKRKIVKSSQNAICFFKEIPAVLELGWIYIQLLENTYMADQKRTHLGQMILLALWLYDALNHPFLYILNRWWYWWWWWSDPIRKDQVFSSRLLHCVEVDMYLASRYYLGRCTIQLYIIVCTEWLEVFQ